MANELKILNGSTVTLEANGGSCADATFVKADDDTLAPTDDPGYPFVRFVLAVTFGAAPTAGRGINLYERKLNIDGTNDAPEPDASYKYDLIGTFIVDGVSTTQYLALDYRPRPSHQDAEYYLENQAGQTISAGWTLKATPFTLQPGA